MSVERNIVFLYPISEKLKELKDELENDESYVVYELDSVAEYGQLIGVMDHSITLSSDFKKTEQYLNECKKFVKGKTAKNFLVQDKNILPHMFTKLQRLGLNEVMQESLPLKSIMHKVNMFFNPFDQKEKAEEEAKNKAVTAQLVIGDSIEGMGSRKESYSSKEKQHIEKMAILGEDTTKSKVKKKKSGFDSNSMFNNSDFSSFELKANKTDLSFLKSPFDNLQRKKVAQFDAVASKSKLKRSSFKAVDPEYGQNPYKGLGIKPPGEIKRRKALDLGLDESGFKKKKIDLDLVESELKKRKINFDLGEEASRKKKKKFDEFYENLKRKKITEIDEVDSKNKKNKDFEEYLDLLKKKKVNLDLNEEEIGKKKSEFNEIEADYDKKKKEFEELDLSSEKKKGLILELEDLKRKKGTVLDELEDFEKKKNEFLEIEIERPEKKKLNLDQSDDYDRKNKEQLGFDDYGKKKGKNFEEVELKKKKKSFEESEYDATIRKKRFDEVENRDDKDGKTFEEVDNNEKKNGLEFEDSDYDKKNGAFEEEERKNLLKAAQQIEIGKNSLTEEQLNLSKKKHGEEQTLDYAKFKKEYLKGSESENLIKQEKLNKIKIKEILEEPEYNFFENKSFGLEYLIIHNDFLLKENITSSSLFKFIHFALMKEYDGDVSFYLAKDSTDDEVSLSEPNCLYSGHRVRKNLVLKNNFEEFEKENFEKWLGTELPHWKDETYQTEINEFIYPYFEEGKFMGCAVSHFREGVKSHEDAAKVELLVMCLKGSIMDEFEKNNGK